MNQRRCGILLHITSLPSPFGIGDLGPKARAFADFLADAGHNLWQILPLTPTDAAHLHSPYHSTSAFAGNPWLISPEALLEAGLLRPSDLEPLPAFPPQRVDYSSAVPYKAQLLRKAYERFRMEGDEEGFLEFCQEESSWLDDFSLFTALKEQFGGRPWHLWPEDIRDREPEALKAARRRLEEGLRFNSFVQYLFFVQWRALKAHCQRRGVLVFGDMPIYVVHDSADVWTHPHIFKLDEKKRPEAVAGVPPDYFSPTGQLWGNPVYRWEVLEQSGFDWWLKRIAHNLALFDWVRIDHFRGFVAYWEIPPWEKTALAGRWTQAPARQFFETVRERFPEAHIVAEDLGVITPDVKEAMARFGFPGMKILLFAFGDDLPEHPYIPHNFERNCVGYTGTHDNSPVMGWFEQEASHKERERVFQYLGRRIRPSELPWEFIRLLMMSVADTVIYPMQDVLGLGCEARMNRPSTRSGNWQWRLGEGRTGLELASRLREMAEIYGRIP